MANQPTRLDLKKLREVAEAATLGEWRSEPAQDGYRAPNDFEAKDHQIVAPDLSCIGIVWDYGDKGKACAEFIATFNPQTILALLDAYEASARDAERYRWLLENPVYVETEDWVWDQRDSEYTFLSDRIDAARHSTQGD
jgi:hypothetical protein